MNIFCWLILFLWNIEKIHFLWLKPVYTILKIEMKNNE